MSQGTQDFIDAAVDSLKRGGHPFLLVALQDPDAKGERVYSIRSAYHTEKDVIALQDLTQSSVPPYLDERRGEAQAEDEG